MFLPTILAFCDNVFTNSVGIFFTEPCDEAGKRDSTLNQVEIDELKALDTAYENAVKLFVSGTTSTPKEPRSYREAVDPNNPDSSSWVAAINAELDSLRGHSTWEYVPRPKDKPIVSCKWVWRVKVKSDGSVE